MAYAYAELQVTSNFSFLRGASHPEELVARAQRAGAGGDRPRRPQHAWPGWCARMMRPRQPGSRFIVGARLDFSDAASVLALSRPTAPPMAGCRSC